MKPEIYEEWLVEKATGDKLKKIRDVSIHKREADDMNKDTEVTCLVYVPKKQVPKGTDDEAAKAELWEKINAMDVAKKPHRATGVKKLEKFIEENS